MKLGFIGAGEMGGAIIKGLLKHGWAKEDILASVHTEASAAKLRSDLGIEAGTDNMRVIHDANWLFIAVKPAQVPSVLEQIVASGVNAKPLICMALGWSVEKIQQVLPKWPVIRIMPNTPLSLGEGVTLFHFAPETPKRARREVMGVFDGLGKTFEVSLPVFNAATAVSGSGPAFVYYFIDALSQAGAAYGLPKEQAAELAQKVATPGGCTAAGMDVMAASDLKKILADTIGATVEKAKAFAK